MRLLDSITAFSSYGPITKAFINVLFILTPHCLKKPIEMRLRNDTGGNTNSAVEALRFTSLLIPLISEPPFLISI